MGKNFFKLRTYFCPLCDMIGSHFKVWPWGTVMACAKCPILPDSDKKTINKIFDLFDEAKEQGIFGELRQMILKDFSDKRH